MKFALNIPQSFKWEECSDIKYTKLAKASQWIYPELKGKIRIAHYSGDTDGIVPLIGTNNWMQDLGWPITEAYTQWRIGENQLGGWTEKREALDLIVIHGAGHMVPQWKRPESYRAINQWLKNESLDFE